MATVKKLIGRLPVYKGDWVAGTYSMLNQVSYLGSTFQSKIDNNTSQPATLVNNVLQVNSNWNVISNGTAAYLADSRLTSVEGKTAVLEQNVSLFNRRPQGLRFKAGNNAVFAKTAKALVLGTDDFTIHVVARCEGSTGFENPVLGYSRSSDSMSCVKVYTVGSRNGHNGITDVFFEGASNKYINTNKTDTTKNLHSIVITRYSETITVIVNGRLVKSSIQNSIFSINNFIYDIANTSYFWGGAVFNYAMTQAESNKLLWNGGRYDEVRLPESLRRSVFVNKPNSNLLQPISLNTEISRLSDTEISFKESATAVSGFGISLSFSSTLISQLATNSDILISYSAKGDTFRGQANTPVVGTSSQKAIVVANPTLSNEYQTYSAIVKASDINSYQNIRIGYFFDTGSNGGTIFIKDITIRSLNVLLEYRPENIRKDRVLNTGVVGTDGDLVYSSTPPEIIYDKPYQDVVMLDENKAPDWHPIAMGQEVETPTNIFKAKLPDVGTEWKVSDWKQINN